MRLLRLLFSVHFLPRNPKRFLATVLHSVTTVTDEEEPCQRGPECSGRWGEVGMATSWALVFPCPYLCVLDSWILGQAVWLRGFHDPSTPSVGPEHTLGWAPPSDQT
jgi:hypothetical protein